MYSELIKNEAKCWRFVRALRRKFEQDYPDLLSQVEIGSRQEALERGVRTVQTTFKNLQAMGVDFGQSEPAHSVGHYVRDYINGLRLISELEMDPRHLFIGFIAGCLHDVGTAVLPRYQESNRAIRHAEAAAILLDSALANFNDAEKVLVEYAVAAHTHYLKPTEVQCADGITRTIQPYTDMWLDLTLADDPIITPRLVPIWMVWLSRWIDRLDVNGPASPGRHFLTLAKEHEDFDGHNFHIQKLDEVMIPKLQADCGIHTMVQHMVMFAGSQNNNSPYGKHDFGRMIELREAYKSSLEQIIQVVLSDSADTAPDILPEWEKFLAANIEPTPAGAEAARQVCAAFANLSNYKAGWLRGFQETMRVYAEWSQEIMTFLETLNPDWLVIPGVSHDIREVIQHRG